MAFIDEDKSRVENPPPPGKTAREVKDGARIGMGNGRLVLAAMDRMYQLLYLPYVTA